MSQTTLLLENPADTELKPGTVFSSQSVSGTIPSPAILEQYKEINPALPDQIMEQYIEDKERTIEADKARIRSRKLINLLSVIFCAVIAIAGITLTGLAFIFAGRILSPVIAIAFALVSVLPLIFFFIFQRSER